MCILCVLNVFFVVSVAYAIVYVCVVSVVRCCVLEVCCVFLCAAYCVCCMGML